MPKSLTAVIADGVRPGSLKATLSNWLGSPITPQDGAFWREWFGGGSFLGKRVSVDQALQLPTAWACVRLISETVATLPCGFYQRNANGSRDAATRHNLYELLHNQPNADMTAVVFWEVVVASMLLWGNAYIEIVRSAGVVVGLEFLMPARMVISRRSDGAYEYRYTPPFGKERVIPEANVMHVLAFSTDGHCGLSPVAYWANAMGIAVETDRASAETFRDSSRASGIVTVDMLLKKDQREEIRAHVKKVSDEGGVYVLEKGAGYERMVFDPVSLELLASRAWNVEEICRWFGLDPVMVGHGGKDSNWGTGLEQKMIWFLTFALRKWCVRIEQAIRKSLLTPVERTKYFAEFAIEGLLRADSASRAAFFSTMTQNGVYTRDECRKLENLPEMGGNAGVLTVQSNMMPIDQLGQMPTAPTVPPASAQSVSDLHAELRALVARPLPTLAPINVDARTNVTAPPAANVTLNVPEQQPAPINVDARTTVNAPPAANVTVNVPEQKSPDVHVDVAAPVVTVTPAAMTVNIEAATGEQTTTYKRDPETNELVASTTRRE